MIVMMESTVRHVLDLQISKKSESIQHIQTVDTGHMLWLFSTILFQGADLKYR